MQRCIYFGNSFCALRRVDLGRAVFVYWIRFFADNVLTNSKVTITRRKIRLFFFVLFGESSDGTRAQITCATAAAGSGLGA